MQYGIGASRRYAGYAAHTTTTYIYAYAHRAPASSPLLLPSVPLRLVLPARGFLPVPLPVTPAVSSARNETDVLSEFEMGGTEGISLGNRMLIEMY